MRKGWRKGVIQLAIAGEEPLGMLAEIAPNGRFAVHEDFVLPCWRITHVATGLKVPREHERIQAVAIAAKMDGDPELEALKCKFGKSPGAKITRAIQTSYERALNEASK